MAEKLRTSEEKALKAILRAEQSRRIFNSIRIIRKKESTFDTGRCSFFIKLKCQWYLEFKGGHRTTIINVEPLTVYANFVYVRQRIIQFHKQQWLNNPIWRVFIWNFFGHQLWFLLSEPHGSGMDSIIKIDGFSINLFIYWRLQKVFYSPQ